MRLRGGVNSPDTSEEKTDSDSPPNNPAPAPTVIVHFTVTCGVYYRERSLHHVKLNLNDILNRIEKHDPPEEKAADVVQEELIAYFTKISKISMYQSCYLGSVLI